MAIRRRTRLLILTLLAALLLAFAPACGSSFVPLDPTETAKTIVDKLAPEENTISSICSDVSTVAPERMTELTKDIRTLPSLLMKSEIDSNLGALFAAFDVASCKELKIESGIDVETLAKGSNAHKCAADLEAALRKAEKGFPRGVDRAASQARFYTALAQAGLKDAKTILGDPLKAARALDLSPAVVVAFISIADGAEKLADDLASNVPYLTGVAKIAARALAAELVATTMDYVLTELETARTINPASVARAACRYYQAPSQRSSVASRVLRRAILRFEPSEWKDAAKYPARSQCDALDKSASAKDGKSPCHEMWRHLHGEEPPTRDPAPPRLRPVGSEEEKEPATNFAERFKTPEPTAKDYLAATELCSVRAVESSQPADGGAKAGADAGDARPFAEKTYNIECSLAFLNTVASILRTYQLEAKDGETAAQREARHRQVLGHISRVEEALRTLDDSVRNVSSKVDALQGTLGATHEAVTRRLEEADNALAQIHAMTGRLMQCQDEFLRIRRARIEFARDQLGICSDPALTNAWFCKGSAGGSRPSLESCSDSSECGRELTKFCSEPFGAHTSFVGSIGGATAIRVAVTFHALCDVKDADFEIDVRTDKAFAPCGTTLDARYLGALGSFSTAVQKLSPRSIRLVGHADERQPGADCKTKQGIASNDDLARKRAEHVRSRLAGTLPATIPLRVSSEGDRNRLRTDCVDTDDTCHSVNRRVTFELTGGVASDFQVDKCKGPPTK